MAGPFEMQLRAFGQKALANYDAAIREGLGNFCAAVIDRSPVGDPSTWKRPAPKGYTPGGFVANWRLGVDGEVDGTILAVDPGREATKAKIRASIPAQASGRSYVFSNPLPYAWRLEMDGWSHQAPFGFLQITIFEWNLLMLDAAQKARSGVLTVEQAAEAVPA